MKYKRAILGGTFDHIHLGHKYFISQALESSQNLTIGLASDKFSNNKPFAFSIESYRVRKKGLKTWLDKKPKNVQIVKINDFYGVSLKEKNIDAIFVTRHGLPNAKIINKRRLDQNLPALKIGKIPFLLGSDRRVISSSRIRLGEIDRKGSPYLNIFKKTLILPDVLRRKIRNIPSGILVQTNADYKKATEGEFVIAVGDIVSGHLIRIGRGADISIVDFKTKGYPLIRRYLAGAIAVRNRRGTINKKAVSVFKKALKTRLETGRKQIIRIMGEEDLLTLSAVLLAPLGSIVLYGMPDKGAVCVRATEEKKKELVSVLRQFS